MSAKMKAYIASDRNGDEGTCIVVFAETAGKAKAYTAGTDTFCDYGFTGIRVERNVSLDRFYHGNPEMDWFDQKDRMAMVHYANMECSSEMSDAECRCEECDSRKWCGRYERMHDDEEDWKL